MAKVACNTGWSDGQASIPFLYVHPFLSREFGRRIRKMRGVSLWGGMGRRRGGRAYYIYFWAGS
eukprot:1395517-Amorphochlora_amoeboformis.AAC.1